MPFPRYSPPLERIREEYSRMVRQRVMAKKRPPRDPGLRPIPDNSTPWVENPRTLDDLWSMATGAAALTQQFKAWRVRSMNS